MKIVFILINIKQKVNYQETIKYMYNLLPAYQNIGKAAFKPDLEKTKWLDRLFGQKHKAFKSIHIAGTNGKGSVSHMLASVLKEAGYKTGLYTSPHMLDFRERIKVNGSLINETNVIDFVQDNKHIIETNELSFFELTVFMAFEYFYRQQVDVAIIETGLGGRLDTTNIIHPIISAITNISYDHTSILGNTLKEIAKEKAGIIKNNTPVIIGETHPETQPVFRSFAGKAGSIIIFADKQYHANRISITGEGNQEMYLSYSQTPDPLIYQLDIGGKVQAKNLITTLTTTTELKKQGFELNEEHLQKGFANVKKNTNLIGRWDVIQKEPYIVCDVAHNTAGIKSNLEQIDQLNSKHKHFILGFVKDKNIDEILKLFPKKAKYYFTQTNLLRSIPCKELLKIAELQGLQGKKYPEVKAAVGSALASAQKNDLIYIGGSTFIASEGLNFFT
jgi:dihydrofolate synthase/folylpolyglutamate synthase